jgi:hypothetical protein
MPKASADGSFPVISFSVSAELPWFEMRRPSHQVEDASKGTQLGAMRIGLSGGAPIYTGRGRSTNCTKQLYIGPSRKLAVVLPGLCLAGRRSSDRRAQMTRAARPGRLALGLCSRTFFLDEAQSHGSGSWPIILRVCAALQRSVCRPCGCST